MTSDLWKKQRGMSFNEKREESPTLKKEKRNLRLYGKEKGD